MKSLPLLILCNLCLLACQPPGEDYVADNALYVQEQEFSDELRQLTTTELEGTKLRVSCAYGVKNINDLGCGYRGLEDQRGLLLSNERIPQAEVRKALEIRRQRILKFLKTYERPFRVRFKNGDLKMLELTESGRRALQKTLSMLDTVEKNLSNEAY